MIFWTLRRRGRPGHVRRAADRPRLGRQRDLHARCCSASRSLLGLPVLTLSPVLGLISGMVFLVKAGILTGAVLCPGRGAVRDRRRDGRSGRRPDCRYRHLALRHRLGRLLFCAGPEILPAAKAGLAIAVGQPSPSLACTTLRLKSRQGADGGRCELAERVLFQEGRTSSPVILRNASRSSCTERYSPR